MHRRTGLTLLEVVVIVIVIAILLGLLLPAIQYTHHPRRRNQCATQLRTLALATVMYEQTHKELPGYLQEYGRFAGGEDPANPGSTAPPHVKLAGWPVALLPSLDAQPMYEIWAEDRYPVLSDGSGEHPAVNGYSTTAAADLATFRCPNSPASSAAAGANSYVSNNGFEPAHSDVTLVESMRKANGAFNNQYASLDVPKGPAIQLTDFADGQGNTHARRRKQRRAEPRICAGRRRAVKRFPSGPRAFVVPPSPANFDLLSLLGCEWMATGYNHSQSLREHCTVAVRSAHL